MSSDATTPDDLSTSPADDLADDPAGADGGSGPAVTVIGAHGKVGRLLLPLLVAAGYEVTGVVRKAEQAADVAATGAAAKVLSVEDASTDELAAALLGQDAVVWSAGAGGGSPERTYAVDRDAATRTMDAAQQVAANRFVMVSWLGSHPDNGVDPASSFFPYSDAKLAADDHLRASTLDWTILGPGTLTLDDPSGTIDVVGDKEPAPQDSSTARGNVAQVVVAALAEPATVGRFVRFTDGATPIAQALRDLAA